MTCSLHDMIDGMTTPRLWYLGSIRGSFTDLGVKVIGIMVSTVSHVSMLSPLMALNDKQEIRKGLLF